MISDNKNDVVYVSDLLEPRHPALAARLRDTLDDHGIPLGVIRGTKDIWCRDYMPGQVDPAEFVRFCYAPDYLRGYKHLITRPDDIGPIPEVERCVDSRIVLDGGNVVGWGCRCIVTDKVFRENPALERHELIGRLRELLGVEDLIVIPKEPYDVVGHADGVVRFLDEDTVVVNDYQGQEAAYGRKLLSIFRQHRLECVQVPYFVEDHATDGVPSAAGCYVNYLRIAKLLILPAFGVAQDDAALRRFESLFCGTRIVPLPCTELARKGGCLNCISWTIRAGRK
jgi:agmatine deiminase